MKSARIAAAWFAVVGVTGIIVGAGCEGLNKSATDMSAPPPDMSTFDMSGVEDMAIGADLMAGSETDMALDPPSAAMSSAVISPADHIAADGSSLATITVTVKDISGHSIRGVTVILSSSGSYNTLTQPALTDDNGVASGTISTSTAETKTISVLVSNNSGTITLDQHPTITFIAVDQLNLRFATQPPTTVVAGVPLAPPVQVQVQDAAGNAVAAFVAVTIAIHDNPGNTSLMGITTVETGPDGVATFDTVSIDRSAAWYTLQAVAPSTASGPTGPTISTQFAVAAAAVDPDQSSVGPNSVNVTADGNYGADIAVFARDRFGNPVPGKNVLLTATGTNNTLTQPALPTDNNNGFATGRLVSTKAETKTVTASVDGTALAQQATVVFVMWTPWTFRSASTVVLDPTNSAIVYAGVDGDVIRSVNGGGNWSPSVSGILSGFSVQAIAVDPSSSSTVYAGASQYIYKSTDSGAHWVSVGGGLGNASVLAIAVDPSATSTVYAGTVSAVYKSTDGGATWAATGSLGTGGEIASLVVDPSTSSTVYAATDTGVFKTTNGGSSWAVSNTGLSGSATSVQALAMVPGSTSSLYAATGSGVFKSTDSGASWSAASGGISSFTRSLAIAPSSPSTIYAAVGGSSVIVYITKDGGVTWSSTALVIGNTFHQLAVDSADPSVAYAAGSMGIYKTTTGGQ